MNSRTMMKYLSDLGSPDTTRRREAVRALAEADERAIYPLIKALRDENPGVQDAAMQSLVEIGGETVAYMVLPLLRETPFLRNTAVIILKSLGRVSVPLLYPLLKDKDEDVRKFVLDLMAEIREDVLPERIMPLLKDTNANVRAAAVRALGAMGYREAVPSLIEMLGSEEEWVCFSVIETFGDLKDEDCIDSVGRFLEHESSAMRFAAIDTLGAIGSENASDMLLRHIMKCRDYEEKSVAVRSLVQIGVTPHMAGVSDILLDVWNHGAWDEKLLALKGLADLKEVKAITHIADVSGSLDISDPRDEERYQIIKETLKGMGCSEELGRVLQDPGLKFKGKMLVAEIIGEMRCEENLPVLREMIRTDKRDIRRSCMGAISAMDSAEAKETMLEFLDDYDSHIRKLAVSGLGRMGDKEVFEVVLGRVHEETYEDVLEEVVRALLLIDPERVYSMLGEFNDSIREGIARFSDNLDMLIALSRDEEHSVRLFSLAGLGRFEEKEAEKRLVEALGEEEPETRRTAIIALGGRSSCYSELQSMLEDEDMWVRLHAVRALGESCSEEVLPVLSTMLNDKDVPVIIAAIEAISRMGREKATKHLEQLLHNKVEAVREAASMALENL